MNTTSRPARSSSRTLVMVGLGCAVVWFTLAGAFRVENGLVADVLWLASTIVALVGVIALALAGIVAIRDRR